jgi:serine-type D-Ala-D-Ala carboxypeptidase (penicillin-binding protein 5/6)
MPAIPRRVPESGQAVGPTGVEPPETGPRLAPGVGVVHRPGRADRRRSSRRRVRRRRRTLLLAAALVVLLVVWLVESGGAGAPPTVSVRVTLPARGSADSTSPAAASPLPWPQTGQAAVSIPAVGFSSQSGPEQPVPVASLTKLMTAYVVLHDHPLAEGAQGPSVTITSADAADFGTDTVTDQASVEVEAGEVLTEHQLLAGLLVHSANDFAYALACWDAGSVTAFVTEMNADAASLGMTASRFADASGYDAASESTATTLLEVAAADMAQPVFASIVDMPAVTLPLAGTVSSYTPLIGTPGVVGVKSGFTTAAGGGDVLAFRTSIGGRTLTVLAAVTSQEGPTVLETAGTDALDLAQAAAARVVSRTAAPAGRVVGRVTAGKRAVALVTGAPATLLVMPGERVRQSVRVTRRPHVGARAGTRVGTATFRVGTQVVSVPVRMRSRLR